MNTDTPEIAKLRREFEAQFPLNRFERRDRGDYWDGGVEAMWQAALWAHRRATQWRPMESAPRDALVLVARFDNGRFRWAADAKFHHPFGWYTQNGQVATGCTHWLPLPPIPSEEPPT